MSTNAQITLEWGTAPSPACYPSDVNGLVAILKTLLSAYLPGTYATFTFGPNTPSPDDQDKPWIKTDNAGFLVGLYVYAGGFWCRPHPIPSNSRQCIIWEGSEAELWSLDGGDGTDPATNPPTDTTGSFWQRATNFNFRVPFGAGTNGTAYDGNPATTINVGDTGGAERTLIAQANLPFYQPGLADNRGSDGVVVDGHSSGDTKNGIVFQPQDGGAVNLAQLLATPTYGSQNPVTISNLAPYIGVIYGKRTARKYITA